MNNNFDFIEYMNQGVKGIVEDALKASLKNPRETAFFIKFLRASKKAETRRIQMEQSGNHIPPFLIASIATKCNLFCKGCYARANQSCHDGAEDGQLTSQEWSRVFEEASSLGISFILLAGGEPLMRRDVLKCAGDVQNIIFPIFTNGTILSDDDLDLFHRKRNLVPIISLEGSREETDERRGTGVYNLIENTMDKLKDKGIYFGTSITVTTENIRTVMEEDFIRNLSSRGCKIIFFVEYVPVSPENEYLAPTQQERDLMEQKLVVLRIQNEAMILLSFPGDEKYSGGCLAAGRGFFHINPSGGAEPCPFSPFSDINVKGNSLVDVLNSRLFRKLAESEFLTMEHKGGCVLFEKEAEVKKILEKRSGICNRLPAL